MTEKNKTREAAKENMPFVVKQVLGAKYVSKFTDEFYDAIDSFEEEHDLNGEFGEKLMEHVSVLKLIRVGVDRYMDACKFCMLYETLNSHKDAYSIVFPERAKKAVEDGGQDRLGSVSSIYLHGKLVQMILDQGKRKLSHMHRGKLNDAMEELYSLAMNGTSERIRMESASKLVDVLTKSDEMTINHNVNLGGSEKVDKVEEIMNAMKRMREEQKALIEQGADVRTIVNCDVQDAEVIDA